MGRLLILSFLCLMAVCTKTQAQNVIITEEPLVTKLMDRFVEINKSQKNIEGWRIQILATTDREKLENVKQTFRYRYPNIPIDWIHNKPYYKLRAGAFASKLEALRLKHVLDTDYPGTYPVKDKNIQPGELISF